MITAAVLHNLVLLQLHVRYAMVDAEVTRFVPLPIALITEHRQPIALNAPNRGRLLLAALAHLRFAIIAVVQRGSNMSLTAPRPMQDQIAFVAQNLSADAAKYFGSSLLTMVADCALRKENSRSGTSKTNARIRTDRRT
jgi:hypothetical protein